MRSRLSPCLPRTLVWFRWVKPLLAVARPVRAKRVRSSHPNQLGDPLYSTRGWFDVRKSIIAASKEMGRSRPSPVVIGPSSPIRHRKQARLVGVGSRNCLCGSPSAMVERNEITATTTAQRSPETTSPRSDVSFDCVGHTLERQRIGVHTTVQYCTEYENSYCP